ncbi:MAG: S-methyl-5'-thioinosine phosphorylase [Gammaproteobacteria bacterium]|nr:S-methyl-5'-thioinosine phosphorylase [Gammaproteobacteria bacterium]
MTKLVIIGGSGFTRMESLEITRREVVSTPYGEPSSPLIHGMFNGIEIIFLPRHGAGHTIPPHKINYRANIWAIKHIEADYVVGMATVGGIRDDMTPGSIAVPDQIIDYTWGRGHTFFENDLAQVTHIDFTEPYCNDLRISLIKAAEAAGLEIIRSGTYGATQGPRLETAMEINRMQNDGCDIVGMTGMPEAALARELGLCYAHCSVVANQAAGRGDSPITMEDIEANMQNGMSKIYALLLKLGEIL